MSGFRRELASTCLLRNQFSSFFLVAVGSIIWITVARGSSIQTTAAVNVTQHHNNLSRDGLYIDPAFTPNNAANVTRDLNFDGTISGDVYAQPLYIEGGPRRRAVVIAVTESNNVYALDATTGAIVWQRNVGEPVTFGGSCVPCIPGITGTPVVYLASRALFFDALTTPDGGTTKRHLIYSLNVDTGATNPGWPVDVNATAMSGGIVFTSSIQQQRPALGLVNGVVYVAFGGNCYDCGSYHGWVVGVPINNPSMVRAWATTVIGGGIWGPGGIASDGTNIFVVTGNTFNTGGTWSGGEAIIRLQAGPVFSGTTTNYWAPTNWLALDNSDVDLGGCGAVLIDVPGATPSQLVLALGKDSNGYLLDRNNLGGIRAPLALINFQYGGAVGQAAATYRTGQGTYFAVSAGGDVEAVKINPANPPTMSIAWTAGYPLTSPWVTATDSTHNAIVWVVGYPYTNERLYGYNGDTGAIAYAGGGANELIMGVSRWNTGIVARGRIYIAADNKVYAFSVPSIPPTPSSVVSRKTHGTPGNFDIRLPLTGAAGIECRSGGATNDYTIVITFGTNVTVYGNAQEQAAVTSGTADIGSGGVGNGGSVTVSGNTVTVPLTHVADAQMITVAVYGVSDGSSYGNLVVPMSRLLADVNGNGAVNSSDVALTKSRLGQAVDPANFRSDVNADRSINASDVSLVKSSLGTGLP